MGEQDILNFGTIKQEDLDHLRYLGILMGSIAFLAASYIGLLVIQCVLNIWYGRRSRHDIPQGSAVFSEAECVRLQEVSTRERRAIRQWRRESWYIDNVGTSSDGQGMIPHDNQHNEEQNHVNICDVSTENDGQTDMSVCKSLSTSSTGNRESGLLPVSTGSWLNDGNWENNDLYVDHDLHGQSETVM